MASQAEQAWLATAGGGNNGQVTSITDYKEPGRSVTYTYDALYRLKTALTQGSANYPQWGLSWTYDRYGNRKLQEITAGSGPPNEITPDPNTNRISGYCYDDNGNLLAEAPPPCPAPTFRYDAENRLVEFQGGAARYTYDGNGLRVKKEVQGGTTTVYIFSGAKVIAEYENGAAVNNPTREYIYSGSALLAKLEGGSTTYYHHDHLSVRVTTDGTPGSPTFGQKDGERGHYPFGESWYESGAGTTKFKFTTYERDSGTGESGDDYAMFRHYMNRFGRFASPDPVAGSIANPQSLNRYTYVVNDPINLTDPLGLWCTPDNPNCGTMDPTKSGGGYGWLGSLLSGGWIIAVWYPPQVFRDVSGPPEDQTVHSWVVPGYWQFFQSPGPQEPPPPPPPPPRKKKKDLIKAALKEKNLAKCLNEVFGPGTILTNENLPRIDASKDLPGAEVGRTVPEQVPETGRATVQIDRGTFTSLAAENSFLVLTYLHEVANALAIQRFTNVPKHERARRGPRGAPPSEAQRNHLFDQDIGQQFEECLRRSDEL